MEKKPLIVKGLAHAAATAAYVALIAFFMQNAKGIFGEVDSPLIPVFMLLLFIISATITSVLVLGRPLQLYLAGSKQEAVILLFATVGWLVAILFAVATAMILGRTA
jgi:hypothetical protein